ncbi:hypothetical protein J2S14_002641 [Lederbergia wuyishanensis]|uniref:Uncharacterized protein n=1 Tax=Lederbergia wuyishanensis TaxID=1347903 RepID=A0ABU0D5X0_9BACI|nr:hypothetical protein [Lederbergia wuyishanensis]
MKGVVQSNEKLAVRPMLKIKKAKTGWFDYDLRRR